MNYFDVTKSETVTKLKRNSCGCNTGERRCAAYNKGYY